MSVSSSEEKLVFGTSEYNSTPDAACVSPSPSHASVTGTTFTRVDHFIQGLPRVVLVASSSWHCLCSWGYTEFLKLR